MLKNSFNTVTWNSWQTKSRRATVESEIDKLSPPWVGNKVKLKNVMDNESDMNKELTMNEINRAVNDSKEKKTAPGKDYIEYIMIDKLPISYKKEICKIFNDMWMHSYLPESWRNYMVIFIEKIIMRK